MHTKMSESNIYLSDETTKNYNVDYHIYTESLSIACILHVC